MTPPKTQSETAFEAHHHRYGASTCGAPPVGLLSGSDLLHLQAFLSHEKLSTVAIYTHIGIARLKELHQAMHPTVAMGGTWVGA